MPRAFVRREEILNVNVFEFIFTFQHAQTKDGMEVRQIFFTTWRQSKHFVQRMSNKNVMLVA